MKTTPPLSCMIIDDEPKAIDILTQLIRQTGLTDQITSHSELTEAKLAIVKASPDVIFLDIHMPQKSGIDFHDELRAIGVKSTIVFVTAYDQYAIHALKRHAYDYLVKPVDYDELVGCLGRLHTDVNRQKLEDQSPLRFNTRTGCIIINPKDIGYITADVNYSHIFLMNGQKETVSVNLGKVYKMPGINTMFRVSRSLVVNFEHLTKIDYSKGMFFLNHFGQTITGKASHQSLKRIALKL